MGTTPSGRTIPSQKTRVRDRRQLPHDMQRGTLEQEILQSSTRPSHGAREHLEDPSSDVGLDIGIQLSEAREGREGLVLETGRGGREREQRGQPVVKPSLLLWLELRARTEAGQDSVANYGFRVAVGAVPC